MVELDKITSEAFEQLISDEEFERILNLIPSGEDMGIERSELLAGTGIALETMKGWEKYEKEIFWLQAEDMKDGNNRVGALTFRMFKKLSHSGGVVDLHPLPPLNLSHSKFLE